MTGPVSVQRSHPVIQQPIGGGEGREPLPVVPTQSPLGADPQPALRILPQAAHDLAAQSVGGGEGGKLLSIVAAEPPAGALVVASGAQPQPPLPVFQQRLHGMVGQPIGHAEVDEFGSVKTADAPRSGQPEKPLPVRPQRTHMRGQQSILHTQTVPQVTAYAGAGLHPLARTRRRRIQPESIAHLFLRSTEARSQFLQLLLPDRILPQGLLQRNHLHGLVHGEQPAADGFGFAPVTRLGGSQTVRLEPRQELAVEDGGEGSMVLRSEPEGETGQSGHRHGAPGGKSVGEGAKTGCCRPLFKDGKKERDNSSDIS